MKISDLYASAWENAISETAYFVNNLDKSPNTYTKNDWVVLEPFAIANQLEFDENGFLIEVPDESVEGCDNVESCGDTQYFADMSNVACNENIEASSEYGMHTSGFSFDFIHDGNYSSEAIKNILWDIFEAANCEFLGIDFESVDYSNSPEYRDYKISQARVDFRWFSLDGYDGDDIISQVEDRMRELGYEVIGNPDFYSLEG